MNFTALYFRFRWLQIPTGLLVMLLQRMPVLRVLTQAECAFEGGSGVVMKSVFALVALGAIDSVAGATMFGVTPATPATGPVGQQFAVSGTANSALSVAFTVTGAPGNPRSWSVSGTLPPGLTVAGGNPINVSAPYKMTISGTPTTQGSWTVTVTAWEKASTSGNKVSAFCVFTIVSGSVNVAPAFTTQPQNATVNVGSAATFAVVATGTPTPTFQWFRGTTSLTGQTATSLALTNVQTTDAGSYTVVATNSVGAATSSAATLAVQTAPSITTQPTSVNVGTGASTNFSVVATGTAPLSYQWLKGGVNIAGATSSTYSISSAQASDVGSYTVAVTNPAGSLVSSAATLTILAAPVVVTQPQSLSVIIGGSALFSVVASGAASLSYQWQLGGVAISGATSATYSISNVQASAAGSYAVAVTNSIGSVTSSAAVLTVTASAVAPTISAQPQSTIVTVGVGTSFSVSAAGTAPLSYQWKKGSTTITGATSATYAIASPQLADGGLYSVVVTNSAGTITSSSATLTVNPALAAPTVTTQPTSETVATGHDVSFSVVTTANPAASYQWSVSTDGGATWNSVQDGANYAGATTGTLTVKNASLAMNGYRYRCLASNSSGSVNSSSLTLSVAAAVFPAPVGLAISGSGVIFVSDSSNNTIQSVNTSWQASVLAGTSGQQGTTDGTGSGALFRQPGGVALDSAGNLYVADAGNSIIRKIASGGVVTTLAGSASNQGYRDGVGTAAWFNSPAAIAVDGAGILYVADSGNAVIRKIAVDGTVSTLAGTAGATGSTDGSGASARFNLPSGIALDVTGNLYVSDTLNQTIRKITSAGVVTTLAGLAGVSGSADGSGTAAAFSQPRGLVVDSAGNVFVADTANSAIRKVTSSGVVTTFAGLSTISGLLDGTGAGAWLNQPKDVKIDAAGNLYVADTGNAAIRKITPATVVDTPVITAAAVIPPSSSSSSGGSSAPVSEGTPPGKSGAGSMDGWFVMGLVALAAMARGWRK